MSEQIDMVQEFGRRARRDGSSALHDCVVMSFREADRSQLEAVTDYARRLGYEITMRDGGHRGPVRAGQPLTSWDESPYVVTWRRDGRPYRTPWREQEAD